MGNERFQVKTAGGLDVLPVANATLYTDAMNTSTSGECQVYIEFFSDAAGTIPTTPTAGTVTAQMSPMGSVWLGASNYGTVNAADAGVNGAYTPPCFNGRADRGRVILSGITGAVTARITFWRY